MRSKETFVIHFFPQSRGVRINSERNLDNFLVRLIG